jgi:Tol biopolymer transport system component
MLLVPLAFAGAGPGFLPGVEGQAGFGAPVPCADGRHVALTRWDRAGLEVLDLATGALTPVTDARGAGFAPAWDGDALVYKAIATEGPPQEAWRWEGGTSTRLDAGALVGQPVVLAPGQLAWTRGDDAVGIDAVGRVDLLTVSGNRLAWTDDAGQLHLRDLATGGEIELDAARGYRPSWSPDGAAIVLEEGGTLSVVDAATDTLITRVSGRHARWADARTLVYDDTVTTQDLGFEEGRSAYAIDSASLRALDVTTGRVAVLLDDSSFHPRFPAPLPDGSLLFVDTQDGSLWRLAAGVPTLVLAGTAAPRRTAAPPDYGTVATDVPYMHQLWDTPDDFDGGWSCGPTSCVQTISKWGILPNADITTSWPYAHTSHWGWYIPNNYTFNGYTYDTWGVAASSNCQGAHGFVCREYGGAVWDYMVTFLNQHGVSSGYAGTSYDTVIGEVNAGYPLVTSANVIGYGHILVTRGYLTSGGSAIHSFVVNDPYGNAGSGDWGNFDGEGIVYDWPGYDNGYLEIEVKQLFYAHGSAPVVDTPPEEETEETPTETPTDTGTAAPVDTGVDSTEPPTDHLDPPHRPGDFVSLDQIGGCSTAPTAWSGLLTALGLLLARRR